MTFTIYYLLFAICGVATRGADFPGLCRFPRLAPWASTCRRVPRLRACYHLLFTITVSDLDDGVTVNHAKLGDVVAKLK